jgi:hypothetical protein
MGRGANNKSENNFLYGGVLQQEAPKEYSKTLWEHRQLIEQIDLSKILPDRCFSGSISQPRINYSGNINWIVKNDTIARELISDQNIISIDDYDSGLRQDQTSAKQIVAAIEEKMKNEVNTNKLKTFKINTSEYAKVLLATIISKEEGSDQEYTVGLIPIADMFAIEVATNYSQGQWLVDPDKKFLFYLIDNKLAGLVGLLK